MLARQALAVTHVEVRINVVKTSKNPWEGESENRTGQKTEPWEIILFKGRDGKSKRTQGFSQKPGAQRLQKETSVISEPNTTVCNS